MLRRTPRGEMDGTITIYTKQLGKISAFAKSIRKPTSKLSGHMQPGNFVRARVIEKNQMQAIDALSTKPKCDTIKLLNFVKFIDQVVPHGEPDMSLWRVIEGVIKNCALGTETYRYILEMLGFGIEEAVCNNCRGNKIAYFSLPDIMFLCVPCSEKMNLNVDEIINIKKG